MKAAFRSYYMYQVKWEMERLLEILKTIIQRSHWFDDTSEKDKKTTRYRINVLQLHLHNSLVLHCIHAKIRHNAFG